ncbi:TraB/GumN family protein [Niabella drilacis]|uniref:Uncharacterized conserved protein YbaP, TraB family n=1 Tax=Niabella drilacis (strain DSM 25811 / CCM 8410 / CCUG 62505 / LMG 26954 / E90) TaxID=1285928 RepID=A0A1G6MUZ1_NIADE|nr:TraB/GumN family protein [Niabella drilacis]SDC58786.1 Uncharacterized conserved protein YbaP, TraB family [Niabella drilacis]
MKISLFILSCFRFPIASVAQETSKIQSALWKIESPTGKTSYILGTIHSFGKSWLDSFPIITNKIEESAIFFNESNARPGQPNSHFYLDSSIKAKRAAVFFGDHTGKIDSFFSSYLGMEDGFSSIIDSCTSYAMQQRQILIYTRLLSLQYRDEILGMPFNPPDESYFAPIDFLVEAIANSAGLKIYGLDDPGYLKKTVYDEDSFSGQNELLMLVNNITALKKGTPNQSTERDKNDYQLYNRGLFDFSIAYNQKRSEIDWTTNVKRNQAWIKKLLPVLKRDNCFIAVGIGHLLSNNRYGVLDILERKGFKISEVAL